LYRLEQYYNDVKPLIFIISPYDDDDANV